MSTTEHAPAPPAGTPVGHQGVRVDVHERPAVQGNGFLGLLLALVLVALAVWSFTQVSTGTQTTDASGEVTSQARPAFVVLGIVLALLALVVLTSIKVIQPGQTAVVQFFGRYIGTARRAGLTWLPPLATRRTVSVRVRNFETERLKVNDADGNPVDIAAIVVWQVADTAQATFAVEDVVDFVEVQSEAALRHVARTYPYDAPERGRVAARVDRGRSAASWRRRSRNGCRSPASRSSRSGSATSRTPPRSPRRCCSASRRQP